MLALSRSAFIAPGLSLVAAGAARADVIAITSNSAASANGLGSFTGTLDYSFIGADMGSLTVSLTNTTNNAFGGFITGFLFNVGSDDAGAGIDFISGDFPFLEASGDGGPPFGSDFDGGAALGGNFTGGGSPNAGIGIGQTGSFTFTVTATDASSLTAASFLEGPYTHNFIVRLRGIDAGAGSDKVPAMIVPAPGALALLALGGMVSRRRRG
jgi:MYXO-CTERM domain-containing protein